MILKSVKLYEKITNMFLFFYIFLFFSQWIIPPLYSFIDRFANHINILFLLSLNFFIIMSSQKIYIKFLFLIPFIIILTNTIFVDYSMGSIINAFNIFLLLMIVRKYKMSIDFIKKFCFIMIIYFFIYINIADTNYYNVNSISYILFNLMIYCVLFNDFKLKRNILLESVVIFICIIKSIEYNSRAFTIGIITFILFRYILNSKVLANKFVYNLIIISIFIGSIIFPYFYVYSYENEMFMNVLDLNGRSLYTGREYIWKEVLYIIKDNIFMGVGRPIQLHSFESFNPHNAVLYFLALYGVPLFIVFMITMLYHLNIIRKYISLDVRIKTLISGFFSLLIISFFEINMFYRITFIISMFPIIFCFSIIYNDYNTKNIRN